MVSIFLNSWASDTWLGLVASAPAWLLGLPICSPSMVWERPSEQSFQTPLIMSFSSLKPGQRILCLAGQNNSGAVYQALSLWPMLFASWLPYTVTDWFLPLTDSVTYQAFPPMIFLLPLHELSLMPRISCHVQFSQSYLYFKAQSTIHSVIHPTTHSLNQC